MYTNINEWKKHLIKKGEIKETFDGDFADADFLPAATDEFEELDTVETEMVSFEQFQDAILTEHEATCKDEEGEDTCQMLDEDQLKLVYDVFIKLTKGEEIEDEESTEGEL